MGIGGLRERSLSWNDKVNAGAKPAKCTSAANEHRRVLAVRAFQSLVIMFNSLKTSFVNSIRICPNVFKSVVSFEATFVAK